MKRFCLSLFTVLLFHLCCIAQNSSPFKNEAYHWDVHKSAKGEIMFLDIPYEDNNQTEYITLSVAKNKSVRRPAFISVILPSNINFRKGLLIAFAKSAKTANGGFNIQLIDTTAATVKFGEKNVTTYTARMVGGYLIDLETGKQFDEYERLLHYDHMMFLFFLSNGSHKSVSVPLYTFKQQYIPLE